MPQRRKTVDLTKYPHILPLRGRTGEFLQVLLKEFTLRKNRPGPGVRLLVDIKNRMPSIRDVYGKRDFNRLIRRTGTRARDALARRLADFLDDPHERECRFDCSRYPFRYANGGVLPVVRLDGRDYFWLFYRDIFPVGWNIANGASDTTAEMLDPNRIVLREFGEEAIAADFRTRQIYAHDLEDKTEPFGFQKSALDAWSKKLKINLLEFDRAPIPLEWIDGPDAVDVTVEDRRRVTKGYFLGITAEDGSIELDRIAFINLGKSVTLLDGEHKNGRILNQVVGLFEIETMRDLARKEWIPDVVFFDGRRQRMGKKTDRGRLKALAVIVEKYLAGPTLGRKRGERQAYQETEAKYDLCPITRSIIARFFEWEEAKKGGRVREPRLGSAPDPC